MLDIWVDDGNVRVCSHLDGALLRIETHDLRRIGRELGAHLFQRDLSAEHAVGVGQRHQCLETRHPHRDLGPVAVPHRFLLAIERAGVRRYD